MQTETKPLPSGRGTHTEVELGERDTLVARFFKDGAWVTVTLNPSAAGMLSGLHEANPGADEYAATARDASLATVEVERRTCFELRQAPGGPLVAELVDEESANVIAEHRLPVAVKGGRAR